MKTKALIILGSTSQIEIFEPIIRDLSNWGITVINIDRWDRRIEIEKALNDLAFPYETIGNPSKGGVRRILQKEQPSIVIVGNDIHPVNKLFVKAANSKGTPTLLVQDGIMSMSRNKESETSGFRHYFKYLLTLSFRLIRFLGSQRSWQSKVEILRFELRYGSRGKRETYGHGECLKIAVFGDATKEMFLSEGINPERIVVTGSPKFDRFFNFKDSECKQRISERWRIPTEKDIVLLITQGWVEAKAWTVEQRGKFISAIVKATAALPGTELIIKLHPVEKEEDYHKLVRDLAHPPIICKYVTLHELLGASSLVITVASTAGLEAMALKKPVVIVNLFNDTAPTLFEDSGAIYATREEELLSAMKSALYELETRNEMAKSMEKFVYEQAYLQDGQAARRIANLIRNMAADKNR